MSIMATTHGNEASTNTKDEAVASDDSDLKKNPHKHDSGAADLEKVTDFVEEKELTFSSASVSNLIGKEQIDKCIGESAKVIIRKEDVELMIRELEISKGTAERKLREHKGNVKAAMKDILTF